MSDDGTIDELVAVMRYTCAVNAALPHDERSDAIAERFFRDAQRQRIWRKLPRKRSTP